MIRTRQIINKRDLFRLLSIESISKVEISRRNNKTLKNPELCSVHIFNQCSSSDLNTIIGHCRENMLHFEEGADKTMISSVISMQSHNFLKQSQIVALVEIQKRTKMNFGISKKIRKICGL